MKAFRGNKAVFFRLSRVAGALVVADGSQPGKAVHLGGETARAANLLASSNSLGN